MKSTRLATLCAALGLAAITAKSHAVEGSDNAANYSTATWTNGSTGGTGFGPWVLTGSSANIFITNPVVRSSASNFTNPAILSTNTNAFSLYDTASAGRSFSAPLSPNDRFTITLAHKWDGGSRGINLYQGTNTATDQIFWLSINASRIAWGVSNQIAQVPAIGWGGGRRELGAVYHLTFTKTPNGFTYEFSSPQASPTLLGSGSVTNSSPLAGFGIYVSGAGGDAQQTLYFNHPTVVALNLSDSDNDGLTDTWEITYFGNLDQTGAGDPDNDGLTNAEEFTLTTNPNSNDTDSDGLTDLAEVNTHRTNPTLADTDGDGYGDGAEIAGTSAFLMVSDPLKKNYARITMPNNTYPPTWDAGGAIALTRVDQFTYRFSNLQVTPSFEFKLTAGDWAIDWGVDGAWTPGSTSGKAKRQGGLPNIIPGLSGIYDLTFNYDTLDVTFSPPGFPTYASFATAFNLLGGAAEDDDADGLSNTAEWTAGTDPTNPDTDADGLADSADPDKKVAAVVTDGLRDAVYTSSTGLLSNAPTVSAVQTTTAASDSNNLANLSALQIGGKLRLFIGGTPQNTQPDGLTSGDKYHYLVFLDSKAGGISQVATNTSLASNTNDGAQINVLAGMKFDANFSPDYCVKVTGGAQNAWVNLHNLQTGGHQFLGESAKAVVSGDIVSAARSSFASNSPAPYGSVTNGTELVLDLAAMGVNLATNPPAPVKMLVILASNPDLNSTPVADFSNGFDQVLPAVPTGSVSGNLRSVDFTAIAGDQFLTLNPAPLPQITLTGARLLSADYFDEFPVDPGAVATGSSGSSLPVFGNYGSRVRSLDGALGGTAASVTYRAVDPATGWYASVSRRLLLGAPQLTEAFIQYPDNPTTNPVTIGIGQNYSYYIQAKGTAVTDEAGAPNAVSFPNFKAQLGYALASVVDGKAYAEGDWTWVDGTYNDRPSASDGRDEYQVPLVGPAPGTYRTVSRFTLNASNAPPTWVVGGITKPGPMNPATPSYGGLEVTGSQLTEAFIIWPKNATTNNNSISRAQTYGYYFKTKGLGVTEAAGAPDATRFPNFKAQLGIASDTVATTAFNVADWRWFDASHNAGADGSDGRDEYTVTINPQTMSLAAGNYVVVTRFTLDSAAVAPVWVYGDLNEPGPMGGVPNYGGLSITQPSITYTGLYPNTSQTITTANSLGVYYKFYSAGITEPAGAPSWPGVRAQLGVSTVGGDPAVAGNNYSWFEPPYLGQEGNNDEYRHTLSNLSVGTYYYASRFSLDNGVTWTYGGAGGTWNNDSVTLVVNAVTPPGSTFAGWSSGAATNSELVGKYAIGGATNSSAASERPVAGVDSNVLSLTAIVRTNDTNLSVVGEAGGSLTNWSTNGVSNSVAGSQAGVPDGCQRQVFSVERTNSPGRQFLRLKATLAP